MLFIASSGCARPAAVRRQPVRRCGGSRAAAAAAAAGSADRSKGRAPPSRCRLQDHALMGQCRCPAGVTTVGVNAVASDSERAKQTAKALAESMGFKTVDAGGFKNARYLEPLAGLNIYLGYGAGLGTSIAPTWMHKA